MTRDDFLKQAIQLELDSEAQYRKLINIVLAQGRLDASEFFHQMAEFSREHREAMQRHANQDVTPVSTQQEPALPTVGEFADDVATAAPWELDEAMALALASEQHGVEFYEKMALEATDLPTRTLAEEFAAEEREHVLALERFMGIRPY